MARRLFQNYIRRITTKEKIQNSFEILKYLKEIIMLNLTKEGIVVQFLPEAKDFWVSLNQVYEKNYEKPSS